MHGSQAVAHGYQTSEANALLAALGRAPLHWTPPPASWSYEPPAFLRLVDDAVALARPNDYEQLLLKLRLALRGPQLKLLPSAAVKGRLAKWAAELLADIRAQQLPHKDLIPKPLSNLVTDFELRHIPFELASIQHRAFHYIGSPRQGLHVGLVHRAQAGLSLPCYLLTFSPFDIDYAAPYVSQVLGGANVLMLARVHGFPSAPRNAFSYAFSKAAHELKSAFPHTDVVLTYVNPNVGFMGASYRAANWLPFAEEPATYLYVGSRYSTARELLLHGTVRSSVGAELRGEPVHVSQQPLLPLRLFAFPLSTYARKLLLRGDIGHGEPL